MRTTLFLTAVCVLLSSTPSVASGTPLVDYVNPFLGTTTLTKVDDVGFEPPWTIWGGLTFPGSSLPNAMVQLSPVTKFRSGSGYEYEDQNILAFAHTSKGHWDFCYIPMMPINGKFDPDDFSSAFDHKNESARPGYYQVFLKRYNINAELTSTLRSGYHKYTYADESDMKLVVNLAVSSEHVRNWKIDQDGDTAFKGHQSCNEKVYFYAITSHKIRNIESLNGEKHRVPVVNFESASGPLEIKIGLSFVSIENAKLNLETELGKKNFATITDEAAKCWEALLSKIQVTGGTDSQRGLFYSCLYRSFLWPALRSDVNGEFTDRSGKIVKKKFSYYTNPSLWDDYRNKLVLLGILSPKVTEDVIQSMVDRGEKTGFMPTFFHGDHAAPFIAGSYLRGLRGFDVKSAYKLLLKNATVENNEGRPNLNEYIKNGYIATPPVRNPHVETKSTAGVTKTLEYAYDDYSIALLARELKDKRTYNNMMKRSRNYANMFDSTTGLMRGRLPGGSWVKPFDPKYPYYEYMYREANAWQSSFFAPHDTENLVNLYPSKEAFEQQLDRLFSIPWNPNHIARNINSFIGQYCHGNQPDHGFPYLYYWVGKQEKTQAILNQIMERFYGMDSGITLCGMDDTGEMSSWYVFNAIGLYPYSPADENYVITVPIFDEIKMNMNGKIVTISRENQGTKISDITYNDRKVDGYSISHRELSQGKQLTIKTAPIATEKYANTHGVSQKN